MPAIWTPRPSRCALLSALVGCLTIGSTSGIAAQNRAAPSGVDTIPAAVVAEAHYTATVQDGVARISCRFVINSLREPWAPVPVNFGTAAVGTLSLPKDKPQTAFLRGLGKGRFLLAVKGKGRHEVRLSLVSKVVPQTKRAQFTFSGPPAGITTLNITLPSEGQEVTVSPAFVPGDAKPVQGKTHVAGHLTAADTITVAWRPKDARQPAGKPTLTVENSTTIRIRESSVFTDSRLEFSATGGVSELQVVVPANHRILDVTAPVGAGSGWSVRKQKTWQLISVVLKKPLSGRLVVNVRTQRKVPEGAVALAGIDEGGTPLGIHAAGVVRETGLLAVADDAAWDVAIERPEGWVPLRAVEVPRSRHIANAVAYIRYYKPSGALTATMTSVKPRVDVKHEARFAIRGSRLTAESRLRYQIGSAGLSAVVLRVPPGLSIGRVSGEHVKAFRLEKSPKSRRLHVAFNRSVSGSVAVRVRGSVDLSELALPTHLELPLIEPINVDGETGRIRLSAEGSSGVSVDSTKSTGLSPIADWDDSPGNGLTVVAVRSFANRPVRMVVELKKAVAAVSVQMATTLELREASTRVTSTIEFDVRYAPVQRFRIAVPAAAVERLRVRDGKGAYLSVQNIGPLQKPDNTGNVAGWSVVAIDARQPTLGAQKIVATYELPIETPIDSGGARAISLKYAPPRVTGFAAADASYAVILSGGEITVQKTHSLKTVARPATGVESIDARQLRRLPAAEGAHFRYFREPAEINLSVTKLVIEPVVATVVSRGLVEVVLRKKSMVTYRCRYRILSSERQRLRLDLPRSAEPLSVFVNGLPVPLERDPAAKPSEEWSSFFLDVSRRDSSDVPFSLVVQFQMPIDPAPFETALGRLQLLIPRISNAGGSVAVVQELRTAIWLPRSFALVGEADGFIRQTGTRLTGLGPRQVATEMSTRNLENWIGIGSPGLLEFPTEGHVYHFDSVGGAGRIEVAFTDMGFATWALCVPLLLLGLVLSRTSWQNRIGVVMLAVFAAAVTAVSRSDEVWHALLAARYGLFGVATLWTINELLARRHRAKTNSTALESERESCPLPIGAPASVVIPPPGVFKTSSARPAA